MVLFNGTLFAFGLYLEVRRVKPVEPSTYRATKEAWLGQLLLPLAFFAVLTFTALWQTGMNPWVGGLG